MQVAGSSYRLRETTILECCSSNPRLQVWFSDNFQDTSLVQVRKMGEQTTRPILSARIRILFKRSSQISQFIRLKRIINLLRQQIMRLTTTLPLHWLKRQRQLNLMPEQIAILTTKCYHLIIVQRIRNRTLSLYALPTHVSIWQHLRHRPRQLSTQANCQSTCAL